MTFRFVGRTFDGIFVVGGDTEANVAVSNIRSGWFNLRAETFFACSMISLKCTVNQISKAMSEDNQRW